MGFRLPKCRWFQRWARVAWCCRWVLGSVAVLALAAWVFTGFGIANVWKEGWFIIELRTGTLRLYNDPLGPNGHSWARFVGSHREGIEYEVSRTFPYWRPTWAGLWNPSALVPRIDHGKNPYGKTDQYGIVLPLWLMIVITAPPALAAWRNLWVVKRDVGRCHICGYARDGLASGAKCPECGNAPVA